MEKDALLIELRKKEIEKQVLTDRLHQLEDANERLSRKETRLSQDGLVASEMMDFIRDFGFVPSSIDEMEKVSKKYNRSIAIDSIASTLSTLSICILFFLPEVKTMLISLLGLKTAIGVVVAVPISGMIHHLVSTTKLKLKVRKEEAKGALENLSKEDKERDDLFRTTNEKKVQVQHSIALVSKTIDQVDYTIKDLKARIDGRESVVEQILVETQVPKSKNEMEDSSSFSKQLVKRNR